MTDTHQSAGLDSRLTRIEDKVDKLTETVTMFARIEERSNNQQLQIAQITTDICSLHNRVDVANDRIGKTQSRLDVIDGGKRAFVWLSGTGIAIIGFLAGFLSSSPPIT